MSSFFFSSLRFVLLCFHSFLLQWAVIVVSLLLFFVLFYEYACPSGICCECRDRYTETSILAGPVDGARMARTCVYTCTCALFIRRFPYIAGGRGSISVVSHHIVSVIIQCLNRLYILIYIAVFLLFEATLYE